MPHAHKLGIYEQKNSYNTMKMQNVDTVLIVVYDPIDDSDKSGC